MREKKSEVLPPIRIRPSLKKEVEEIAAKQGRTLSNYVVTMLEREVKKEKER